MSIWQRIGDVVDSGAGAVGALLERAADFFGGIADPVARRQVAFSIAMVALSAKMAKADGVVTSDEEAAFRSLFSVPDGEARNIDRLFSLAKRDVAGFESYARKIAAIYGEDRQGLEDVIDGLFAIAKADGAVHEGELAYLQQVAAIFGIVGVDFERIAARHFVPEEGDPYLVLGVERRLGLAEIRKHYRKLVAENHPDRLIARGVPEECIAIATDRMAAINRAWERIERDRGRG
jgi:DnaJ like chaperone protein